MRASLLFLAGIVTATLVTGKVDHTIAIELRLVCSVSSASVATFMVMF